MLEVSTQMKKINEHVNREKKVGEQRWAGSKRGEEGEGGEEGGQYLNQ